MHVYTHTNGYLNDLNVLRPEVCEGYSRCTILQSWLSPQREFEPVFSLFLIPPLHVPAFHLAHDLSSSWNASVFAFCLAQSCCLEHMNLLQVRQDMG